MLFHDKKSRDFLWICNFAKVDYEPTLETKCTDVICTTKIQAIIDTLYLSVFTPNAKNAGKMRTRIPPNTDSFYAMHVFIFLMLFSKVQSFIIAAVCLYLFNKIFFEWYLFSQTGQNCSISIGSSCSIRVSLVSMSGNFAHRLRRVPLMVLSWYRLERYQSTCCFWIIKVDYKWLHKSKKSNLLSRVELCVPNSWGQ